MLKTMLAALALSLAVFVVPTQANAETHHMLASCQMSDSICNNETDKRNLALQAARWHVKKDKGSGSFKFIMQADSNDTVIEYTFNYLQSNAIVAEPDGRDMFYPATEISLTKESYLTNERKTAAKWLISPAYNTRKIIQEKSLPSRDGNTINLEGFCGTTSRDPFTMIDACTNALQDEGALRLGNIQIETATNYARVLTASGTGVNISYININNDVNKHTSFADAKKLTAIAGLAQVFTSTDGVYRITLVPNPLTGKITVERFWMKPNILLSMKDGDIDFKKLNEQAATGTFTFNSDNINFVKYVSSRTRLKQWQMLADLLDAGYTCPACRVTIRDVPQPKKK